MPTDMNSWRQIVLGLFIVACLVLSVWAGAIIVGIAQSPLSFKEMDMDHDGEVSLSEIDYASSFGQKEVIADAKKCIQYFALKDGRSLKLVCPEK